MHVRSQVPCLRLVVFGWVLHTVTPALAGPVVKDLFVITECEHRSGCSVESRLHPRAGDVILEQEGFRYADFDDPMAFVRKVMEAAGEKSVLSLKVRRGTSEVVVRHGSDDGVEFKTVSPTARRVALAEARADARELFEALERVYIDGHRTREPWYAKARDEVLASLDRVTSEGRVLVVDLYAVLARLLSRFDDGHLDVVSLALTSELDPELYVEGRRGLPLRIVRYRQRYYMQPVPGAAPVEVISVDGTRLPDLIDRLAGCVSGDTKSSREEFALRNFSALHYLHVARSAGAARKESYDLVVTDRPGASCHISIPAGIPLELEQGPRSVGEARSVEGVDVLTLNAYHDGKTFTQLVDGFFAAAQGRRSPAVVIDQRCNGGGSSQGLKHLLFLLEARPFTIYEGSRGRVRVLPAARPATGESSDDTRPFCERFSSRIEETRIGPGDYYKPRAGAFAGRVLLLIGPRNYSTSVDSVIALKNRGNVTTVGSKTGGRASSPGDTETWKGPRTGVSVTVPVGFYQPKDYKTWTTEEGDIAPDVAIENRPFSQSDEVMLKALSLAKEAAKGRPPQGRSGRARSSGS